jgi:dienelactone hydrolase
LICHGAADSFIPDEAIQKVRSALEQAHVDYQIIYYGGAQHSFTVADADERGLKGMRYNAAADRRSWSHMMQLFNEVFAEKK